MTSVFPRQLRFLENVLLFFGVLVGIIICSMGPAPFIETMRRHLPDVYAYGLAYSALGIVGLLCLIAALQDYARPPRRYFVGQTAIASLCFFEAARILQHMVST